MNGYPRKDGTWTFYMIEGRYESDPTNDWSIYNWYEKYDRRTFIESMGGVYEESTLGPSGKVWQATGINGTEDADYCNVLLRLLRRDYPQHDHRIVKMTVSRETEVTSTS